MPPRIDIPVGSRFGRLVTVEERRTNVLTLACVCDCGRPHQPPLRLLLEGRSRSCGCLAAEAAAARATRHGYAGRMDGTPRRAEYEAWLGMRRRCSDTEDPAYVNYGGRGITVCERWRNDFAAFLADMGPKPAGTSLDRVDNDGDYEPGNCRWATRSEQMLNRRPLATSWSREGAREPNGRFLPKEAIA